jgi:hypothetical protein
VTSRPRSRAQNIKPGVVPACVDPLEGGSNPSTPALAAQPRETGWSDISPILSHRLCALTYTLPAITMVVAEVLFGLASAATVPKELVSRNHEGNVSVYTIYKETHSSDDPATCPRHYAGWTADKDDAIRRANEIYEVRDSTKAVLVLGNGRTGVEVVYRVGDEN